MKPRTFMGPDGTVTAIKLSNSIRLKIGPQAMQIPEGYWVVGSPPQAVVSDEEMRQKYFGDHEVEEPVKGVVISGLENGRT